MWSQHSSSSPSIATVGDESKAEGSDRCTVVSRSSSVEVQPRKKHKHREMSSEAWKCRKKKTKGRQVVDNNHIGPLVEVYWLHFGKFSECRKQKTTHLVPKKVWAKVYLDYKKIFPHSPFEEETLEEHLQDTVKDMKSGVNNPEEGEAATPQDPKSSPSSW